MHKIILIIILAVFTLSCENNSDKVISKSKMEQVLYDYHLAQSLVSTLSEEERYKAEMYINSIYEKNGITEEEFDSSMVYYNRHADDLKDIYDNLHDRFVALNEKVQLQTGNNEMLTFSENGDTTNIWGGKNMYVLRNNELENKEIFKIKADTSFYKGDKFILKTNVRMINPEKNSRNYRLTMCLIIKYTDGKQISEFQNFTTTSSKQITLNTDANKELEHIDGYFYYEAHSDERNFSIVDGIELIKIHTISKNDTLVNSVKINTDTIISRPTPDQKFKSQEEKSLNN